MAKKKKGLYVVISPEFTGTVQSLKEYNKYVVGKKQAKGKKVANEAEANEWLAKNNVPLSTSITALPKIPKPPVVGIFAICGPDFTGIVHTNIEFQQLVWHRKGMKGKRCHTELEAQKWINKMSGKTKTVPKAAVKPIVQKVAKQGQVILYIDGGYKEPIGTYGIVAYATKGTDPIHRDFGYVYDERLNSLKNTGAELMACIRALEWAFANHYTQVTIIYDYEGIINHLDKAPSTEGTTLYYEMIQRFKQTMDIHFLHIRHGNKVLHNEAHNLTQMTI